jgi:hypothetical protein
MLDVSTPILFCENGMVTNHWKSNNQHHASSITHTQPATSNQHHASRITHHASSIHHHASLPDAIDSRISVVTQRFALLPLCNPIH